MLANDPGWMTGIRKQLVNFRIADYPLGTPLNLIYDAPLPQRCVRHGR